MNKFLKFKQGTSRQLGKAPHKPILMLAVIEAIDKGAVQGNKIFITPELISYFRDFWNSLVLTNHTPNFSLPFFHLKNEKSGAWYLQNAPGFENAITSSNSIKSLKALMDYVEYAYLDKEFYSMLNTPIKRLEAKQFILSHYFNKKSANLQYSLLNDAEQDIFNDDPTSYVAKMRKVLSKSANEVEEEVFVRNHAFKKAIPKIYNGSCAISKLKVSASYNVSMIDACHIVPFSESKNDHVTNGISLSPNLHRAFDRGLISIDENYKVITSNRFIENDSKYSIKQFEGEEILLPSNPKYYPNQSFLESHRIKFGFN